ncbi:hypothetical protein PU298_004570 [Enterobacter kobei]
MLEFDNKKDYASHCGSGLVGWKHEKPVLLAKIKALTDQLQLTLPGFSA